MTDPDDMEEPCVCPMCGEWVELRDSKMLEVLPEYGNLVCPTCYNENQDLECDGDD